MVTTKLVLAERASALCAGNGHYHEARATNASFLHELEMMMKRYFLAVQVRIFTVYMLFVFIRKSSILRMPLSCLFCGTFRKKKCVKLCRLSSTLHLLDTSVEAA